jgi:cytoskeletal protein CcmA (bactofilin family)
MTTIGPSLHITGDVSSHEDITVHGRVNGKIRMVEGALLVAPKGHVDAHVQGARITIHGIVAGDVTATQRLELTATAEVTGTLSTPSLVLQDGAVFNGIVETTHKKAEGAKPRPVAVPVAQAS